MLSLWLSQWLSACLFNLLALVFRPSSSQNIVLSSIIFATLCVKKDASDTFLECLDLWDFFFFNHSGMFYMVYHTVNV